MPAVTIVTALPSVSVFPLVATHISNSEESPRDHYSVPRVESLISGLGHGSISEQRARFCALAFSLRKVTKSSATRSGSSTAAVHNVRDNSKHDNDPCIQAGGSRAELIGAQLAMEEKGQRPHLSGRR